MVLQLESSSKKFEKGWPECLFIIKEMDLGASH